MCPTRLIAWFSSSVCCGSIGIATARFAACTACATSSRVSSFESTLDATPPVAPPPFAMQSLAAMTASTPPCLTSTSWPSLVIDTRCSSDSMFAIGTAKPGVPAFAMIVLIT